MASISAASSGRQAILRELRDAVGAGQARCAVPKASCTNTSHSAAIFASPRCSSSRPVDAAVLQQHHLAGRDLRRRHHPDGDQRHLAAQQLAQAMATRASESSGLNSPSVGRPGAGDHHRRAGVQRHADAGHRGADAGVLGDAAGVVLRHVEVGADEPALTAHPAATSRRKRITPSWWRTSQTVEQTGVLGVGVAPRSPAQAEAKQRASPRCRLTMVPGCRAAGTTSRRRRRVANRRASFQVPIRWPWVIRISAPPPPPSRPAAHIAGPGAASPGMLAPRAGQDEETARDQRDHRQPGDGEHRAPSRPSCLVVQRLRRFRRGVVDQHATATAAAMATRCSASAAARGPPARRSRLLPRRRRPAPCR